MAKYCTHLVSLAIFLIGLCAQGCMTTNQVYTEQQIVDTLSSSPPTMEELRIRLARAGGTTVEEAKKEMFVVAEGPEEVEKWRNAVESSPSWQESLESIYWSEDGSFDRVYKIYEIIARPRNLTQQLESGPTFRVFEDKDGTFVGWVR